MCILTKERVRVEPDTDSYIYIYRWKRPQRYDPSLGLEGKMSPYSSHMIHPRASGKTSDKDLGPKYTPEIKDAPFVPLP